VTNIQPDISLATKTGHFNLLTTMPFLTFSSTGLGELTFRGGLFSGATSEGVTQIGNLFRQTFLYSGWSRYGNPIINTISTGL